MPKVTVELDWDTVDGIVVSQLQDSRKGLISDLEQRKKKGSKGGIFSTDRKKDIILIKEHIDAFEMVIKYFGGQVED
jgi:hypothetical protein